MGILETFAEMVSEHTGKDPKKALALGDYLTIMGVTLPARRASARAQLTRAMKVGGPLRHLIDSGLVLADMANRQPQCFDGVKRAPATLPVVIEQGPIAEVRAFPERDLTPVAIEAKQAVVTTLSTARLPVRAAEGLAQEFGRVLFEVERQKLRADAADEAKNMMQEHAQRIKEMYDTLVSTLQKAGSGEKAGENE